VDAPQRGGGWCAAIAVVALIASVAGCARATPGANGSGGGNAGGGRAGGAAAGGLELRRTSVTDPQLDGIEAYSLLIPDGWQFTGSVEWRHDLATLASAVFVAEDPATGTALETYFLVPHVFSDLGLIAEGRNSAGAIVARPRGAADYLTQLMIPSVRPQATVVSSEELAAVADATRATMVPVPGATADADAARVRIRDVRGGTAFDEDFFVTLTYYTGSGVVNWTPSQLHSMRAPAGTLDAAEGRLETVLSSLEVTPLWSANYQAVFDLFLQGQYAGIRAAGELSQYLARTADQISDLQRKAYEDQQAAYDRVQEGYSQSIQGIEPYEVPEVGRVLIANDVDVCSYGQEPHLLLLPSGTGCPQGLVRLQPVR
jgi:hypothetical protein